MISLTAEYALRALLYLAMDPATPRSVKEMAGVTKVPEGYLSKVMQALARSGLVVSQRGLHGGFCLDRDPGSLTILEIVNAVDPLPRIHTCPLGIPTHGSTLCPMHRRLDEATQMVERAFGDSTLAELLAEPTTSRPLCELQGGPPADAAPSPRARRLAARRAREAAQEDR